MHVCWYDTMALGLLGIYLVGSAELAWKLVRQAYQELIDEQPHPPAMTIADAILYGESLLSADENIDQ